VSPEDDERPTDDADRSFDLSETDDDEGGPANPGSLLGALGQIAAAVLVVVVLVALFIGSAVAYRWIFR
jgi:hypothetical protein